MTFTREQLTRIIESADEVITALAGTNDDIHPDNSTKMCAAWDDLNDRNAPPSVVKRLAELALAGMEAEPVAWLWSNRKHPSEVTLVRPEDDDRAEAAQWSGWSCQALYSASQSATVVAVSVPDLKELETILNWILMLPVPTPKATHFAMRLAVVIEDCRAATLPANHSVDGNEKDKAEPVSNRDELAVTQFKPVADLYGITSPTGSETIFTFDAVEARDFIDGGWSCQEYVELERYQEAVSGNSPVIPDGWVAVPVEPTEHMIVEGFESEPDEFFSDAELWEAYNAMTGCQQAAHRAKLCWAAMIAASQKS